MWTQDAQDSPGQGSNIVPLAPVHLYVCRQTVLTDYSVSDGGTPKKKFDGRSDLTLGGNDVKTGRGKAEELNFCTKHTKVMFCNGMNSTLLYSGPNTKASTCVLQDAVSERQITPQAA